MGKFLLKLLMIFLFGCQLNSVELNWHHEDGYRWADIQLSYFGNTGFKKLDASETSIPFEIFITPEEIRENQMLLHGSGVAAADVDGDGLVDLYFGQLNGPNKLFKNRGNFQFQDITEEAGVAHDNFYTTGVLFADITGEGNQDLIVNTLEGNIGLYLNDGTGQFSRIKDSGLGEGNGGSTLTMADINGNGLLDLFIANNKYKRVYDIIDREKLSINDIITRPANNENDYNLKKPFEQYYDILFLENKSPKLRELGTKNKLFINEGNGRFRDVTNQSGRFVDYNGNPFDHKAEWSLTARFQDINGNGLPDLYVTNDYFGPDRVWINQGDGTFRALNKKSIRNYSYSSMGIAISDINRDGNSDIFVSEMLSQLHSRRASQQTSIELRENKINSIDYQPQYMRNSLYVNRGDHTYTEIAYYSDLEASEWSWTTMFLDVDLDGYEDLVINTGFAYDSIDMDYFYNPNRKRGGIDLDNTKELTIKNKIFHNNQDLTFTEKSNDWGFSEQDVSYGMILADLNNDGDLDLVSSRFNAKAAIYENTINEPRIGIRLKGKNQNSQIIGSEITVEGGPVKQSKELVSGGDYLSSSPAHFSFAATPENNNHKITVLWPNGTRTEIDSVRANRIYEIDEPDSKEENLRLQAQEDSIRTIYKDVSDRITHIHHEEDFDDFRIQPLLPIKLSRFGPGVSWIDLNQNGMDDLLIGSGKGGKLAVFENQGNGTFLAKNIDHLTGIADGDQTTIVSWSEENLTNIVIGYTNYEQNELDGPSVLHFKLRDGHVTDVDSLPGALSTTGPLAAADYNNDGSIDLFVGGNFLPGQYPRNASSRLFKNVNGRLVLDEINSSQLEEIGLVTGSVFTDFNNNGVPDLLVSRAWDSLVLFENRNGTFVDVSEKYKLEPYKGWWNGVATGDFNNDGLTDIIATNRGLNSSYQIDSDLPIKMYYDDLNRNGLVDIIESYYDPVSESYVPERELADYEYLSTFLLRGINSYRDFANTSIDDLLLSNYNNTPSLEINTLAHQVFMNKGSHFEPKPLPEEAQFSAAFNPVIMDYNNDGFEDVFLSQNFFGVPPAMPRLDGGRGLLLEGKGNGDFNAVPGHISGIKVYGEQRGAAFSDFNGNGKTDLAISQNDTTTKLYLNQLDRRGITVRLKGSNDNGSAIGSKLWLEYEDGTMGPVRDIQAGEGYWSQNSTTQVLGIKDNTKPVYIQIQWYNGEEQTIDMEPGKWDYPISLDQ